MRSTDNVVKLGDKSAVSLRYDDSLLTQTLAQVQAPQLTCRSWATAVAATSASERTRKGRRMAPEHSIFGDMGNRKNGVECHYLQLINVN